jgi:hypothetical protein
MTEIESTPARHAHTPGPWSAEPSAHQREFSHWIGTDAVVYGRSTIVAGVLNGSDSNANARLMAAAPELLDACRAGGRYCDALRPHQDAGARGTIIQNTGELERLFVDWYDKLCAAIAKAEGR